MKKNALFLCSLIFIMLIYISPVHAMIGAYSNIYDIQAAGDTLWSIARKYDTSVNDLKVTNGLQSDLVFDQQKLWVPTTYEVASGDTLWRISQAYNSSVQSIKETNGLSSDIIYVGQELKVPQKKLPMQGHYVLMKREEFKDWLFHHKFNRKISLIQQHHTWKPSYAHFTGTNHFSLLKGMEYYHTKEVGWSNIAQTLRHSRMEQWQCQDLLTMPLMVLLEIMPIQLG